MDGRIIYGYKSGNYRESITVDQWDELSTWAKEDWCERAGVSVERIGDIDRYAAQRPGRFEVNAECILAAEEE